MRKPFCLALLASVLLIGTTWGHYHMLLPDSASTKKGETVRLLFQFGHPFEHQMFNASKPYDLIVLAPDGKKTNLLPKLEAIRLPGSEDKKVRAYQLQFTPEQRGDYVFLAQTDPIWMEEDKEFLVDTVKVVLHVQAQKGWDGQILPAFELTPLTRPYGLLPGMVFQAQILETIPALPQDPGSPMVVLPSPAPLGGALVEIERYNARPPKELPPDELITRTARTDLSGAVTTTLTEPGWWGLTVVRKRGQREHEGKKYPIVQRSSLWVYVQEKPAAK